MDSGPQNVILGDNFGTELPETKQHEEDLRDEMHMARFSKTSEFRKLKEHLEARIEFYQSYLPDGRNSISVNQEELAHNWIVANTIIREFKAVLQAYENAREAVEKIHGKN